MSNDDWPLKWRERWVFDITTVPRVGRWSGKGLDFLLTFSCSGNHVN